MVGFWFGSDLDRLATDKEYARSFSNKWCGTGPPDDDFIGTQNASKELIQKAARLADRCQIRQAGKMK